MEPIQLYKRLIHAPSTVQTIRASCISSYWFCTEKARLQALGVEQSNPIAAATIGTLIHNNIIEARQPSILEQELAKALEPFYLKDVDDAPIISRAYKNTKIQADGTFLTHGADEWKVTPDHKAWIIEYKTKSSDYIKPVDLSPARFQNKLYCWLYAPIFSLIPFQLAGGQIVFLKRVGQNGEFREIGQTEYIYWNEDTETQLLADIERILWSWNNPEKQIPPKRYKCINCANVFKSKCIFQTGVPWKP